VGIESVSWLRPVFIFQCTLGLVRSPSASSIARLFSSPSNLERPSWLERFIPTFGGILDSVGTSYEVLAEQPADPLIPFASRTHREILHLVVF